MKNVPDPTTFATDPRVGYRVGSSGNSAYTKNILTGQNAISVKGLTTSREMMKCDVCQYIDIKEFK